VGASLPGSPPALEDLPDELADLVGDREWIGVPTWSATDVWRLDPPGTDPFGPPVVAPPGAGDGPGTRFLKLVSTQPTELAALEREIVAIARVRGRLPVPAVLGTGALDDRRGWLVTAALPGADGRDPIHRVGSVEPLLLGLGRGLRAVHDLPADGWPTVGVADVLALAGERVAAGLVDPAAFDPALRRYSATDLLQRATAMAPPEPDQPVVSHGDYGVANVLLVPGTATVSGYVDWGGSGVGDPHRDLAVLARTVARHLSPEIVWRVLDAYGRPHPDPRRLNFWDLLHQLL
jgi:aminoglycoside 3'-phosphotransferase II